MFALNIGIVGCGTAGPAAALFLLSQGHSVTLYESVKNPETIGAGILLQPTGQAVLRILGLLEEIETRSSPIDGLHVLTPKKPILRLAYSDINSSFYGLGVHRGVLFSSLYKALLRSKAHLVLGVSGLRSQQGPRNQVWLIDTEQNRHGPHDLLVIADGARSRFRDEMRHAQSIKPYSWGALWFVGLDPSHGSWNDRKLLQFVDGTQTMVGFLPSGLGPANQSHSDSSKISLYFSLRSDRLASIPKHFHEWKRGILSLAPWASPLLEQIQSPSDLLFASYLDASMWPYHRNRVVYIGDAAHAMSPQLGQGANLALWDAMILSECIRSEKDNVQNALSNYSYARKAHLQYYQFITRMLTPWFQSDEEELGILRDLFFPLLSRIPWFRHAMIMGMCGNADGHPWKPLVFPSPTGL